MLRSFIAIVVSATVAACISPATRPAKIKQGFSASVSGAVLFGAKNERRCSRGCTDDEAETISFLNFDARYGHHLSEDSAIAFGAYVASGSTTKIEDAIGNGYVQTAYQTDQFAASIALELGANAVGPTGTVQYWPNPIEQHLSIAAYARALRPLSRDDSGGETSVAVATWDAGVAFRIARVLLQYSYYSRQSGFESISVGFESSEEARDWHIFVVGHEF